MRVMTFVVPAEHLDECVLGYNSKVKRVLVSEFFDGAGDGDRMCRMVCEVK